MSALFSLRNKKTANPREQLVSSVHRIPFTLHRRKGKLITLRISSTSEIVVHAPRSVPVHTIIEFVDKKSGWIKKQIERIDDRTVLPELSDKEKKFHSERIHARAASFLLTYDGQKPKRIFVRYSKTRWGSCSTLGNISLNGYLDLLPDDLFRYVILHELTHLVHMNHSPAFWNTLASQINNPKALSAKLNAYKIPNVKDGED